MLFFFRFSFAKHTEKDAGPLAGWSWEQRQEPRARGPCRYPLPSYLMMARSFIPPLYFFVLFFSYLLLGPPLLREGAFGGPQARERMLYSFGAGADPAAWEAVTDADFGGMQSFLLLGNHGPRSSSAPQQLPSSCRLTPKPHRSLAGQVGAHRAGHVGVLGRARSLHRGHGNETSGLRRPAASPSTTCHFPTFISLCSLTDLPPFLWFGSHRCREKP